MADTMAHSKKHRHGLMDLDDACLMRIFKQLMPLPDLFQVAQTCWRFHRLTSDKRMWLVVAPSSIPAESTPSGRAGVVYTTLKAAVKASRPGDTIWLAPGMVHDATEVIIPWPLHILGGGHQPEDTQLITAQSADFALSFSASAKLAMLAISTSLCPCLVHRKGMLTVERCRLFADPRGLQHLVSPVVTVAASSTRPAAFRMNNLSTASTAQQTTQLLLPSLSMPISSRGGGKHVCDIGSGKLAIVECRLEGGSTAVRCEGTGRLREVRVIYESRAAFFWLEVDSFVPGVAARWTPAAALAPCIAAGTAADARLLGATQQLEQNQVDAAATEQMLQVSKVFDWQKQRKLAVGSTQQEVGLHVAKRPLGGSGIDGAACPLRGLARIHHVLGKRVNPSALAAHIQARQQQEQGDA